MRRHLNTIQSERQDSRQKSSESHRYHRAMSDRFRMSLNKLWFLVMRKTEALFLQNLLNVSDSPRVVWSGDYFLCNGEFLEGGFWQRSEQDRYLNLLRKRGFITTRRIKRDGKAYPERFVRINHEPLQEALDRAESLASCRGIIMPRHEAVNKSKSKNTTYSSSYSFKKKNRPAASPRDGTPSIPPSTKSLGPEPRSGIPAQKQNCPVPVPTKPKSKIAAQKQNGPDQVLLRTEDGVVPAFVIPSQIKQNSGINQDMTLAHRYRELARTKGWPPALNLGQWAGAFGALRLRLREAGRESELIETVDWYLNNSDSAGLPTCENPFKFSRLFEWIRGVYKRSGPKPVVEVSDEAREIAEDLEYSYNLSDEWSKALPSCVQQSLDNFAKVCVKLRSISNLVEAGRGGHLGGNAENFLLELSPDFIREWIEDRIKHYWRVERKYGTELKPDSMIFTSDHPNFDVIGRKWVREWSDDEDDWMELKSALSNAEAVK